MVTASSGSRVAALPRRARSDGACPPAGAERFGPCGLLGLGTVAHHPPVPSRPLGEWSWLGGEAAGGAPRRVRGPTHRTRRSPRTHRVRATSVERGTATEQARLPAGTGPCPQLRRPLGRFREESTGLQITGLNETAFIGEDDRLDAVAHTQLREDVGDVGLDRRLTDVEQGGDLRVG